jgi:hypothetical protein
MVARVVVGVTWSLITGLGGGWLLISPWALGVQSSSGDWSDVTKAQFWTGAGLVALAVIGLAVVATQIGTTLRGVRATPGAAMNAGPAGGQRSTADTDAALIALANALVADLNRQPAAQPPSPYPAYPTAPPQPPAAGIPPPMQPSNGPPPSPQVPQGPPVAPPAGTEPWRNR